MLQIIAGIYMIYDAIDITENAQPIKFKCSIPSLYREDGRMHIYTHDIKIDYTKNIPLIDKHLSEKSNNKNNLHFFLKLNTNIVFTTDKNGFAQIKDYYPYSTKSPDKYAVKEVHIKRGFYKNKEITYYKTPKIEFPSPNSEMYFSEDSAKKVKKYLDSVRKKYQGKEQSELSYVVYKMRGNKVITIDCVVDGKSLKEIAKSKL